MSSFSALTPARSSNSNWKMALGSLWLLENRSPSCSCNCQSLCLSVWTDAVDVSKGSETASFSTIARPFLRHSFSMAVTTSLLTPSACSTVAKSPSPNAAISWKSEVAAATTWSISCSVSCSIAVSCCISSAENTLLSVTAPEAFGAARLSRMCASTCGSLSRGTRFSDSMASLLSKPHMYTDASHSAVCTGDAPPTPQRPAFASIPLRRIATLSWRSRRSKHLYKSITDTAPISHKRGETRRRFRPNAEQLHTKNGYGTMGNAVVRVNGHVYENQGVLAEGGFATVVRVRRGDAQFALKWTRGIGDDAQLQRMLLEIQVQRKLQHPNTMRLVEAEVRVSGGDASTRGSSPAKPGTAAAMEWMAVQRPKEVLMVFPLYPRGTLQHHIEQSYMQQIPAFTEADCLRVFTLLAESVLELQARGYAHRDIKPHNVLLTSSDPMEPVLTDFGSIYPVKTSIMSAHDALELFEDAAQFCSAAYRAPELWESHSTTSLRGVVDSGRADVWSLGCVLYAMAFGPFSPFESPTQGVQQLAIFSGTVRFPPNYARFGQTHSPAFIGLIQWMLNVSAHDRPTIYQVLDRVDELRSGRSRSRTSSRSASLRRAISTKQPSLRPQKSNDWADFSAFQNHLDNDGDAISPQSDLTVPSVASASSLSAVSRTSSWHVVSRQTSIAGDDTSSLRSNALSTSTRDDEPLANVDDRRRLSIQGRHLLASALAS